MGAFFLLQGAVAVPGTLGRVAPSVSFLEPARSFNVRGAQMTERPAARFMERENATVWALDHGFFQRVATLLIALIVLSGAGRLFAAGVVTNCTQTNLMLALAGGGEVTFATDCDITLTQPIVLLSDVTLNASGHTVTFRSSLNATAITTTNIVYSTNRTLSSSNVTCFTVTNCITNITIECFTNTNCSTNITYTTNITSTTNITTQTAFTNGFRIFEVGENVRASFVSLRFADGRNTNGGALYVHPGAEVVLTNCTFTGNRAIGANGTHGVDGNDDTTNGRNGTNGKAGESASGGAIYNLGRLTAMDCQFVTNSATGGNGGNGGSGGSGEASGGNGGDGGAGGVVLGGAIFNGGELLLTNCTLAANTATGGHGGTGGAGGESSFPGHPGKGGAGGDGSGAGVYSIQSFIAVNCTFSGNIGRAGNSRAGGTDTGGNGENGARGRDSLGGGVCNLGDGSVTNCTFFGNQVTAGNGGDGGPGDATGGDGGNGGNGAGGGLYNAGAISVVNCTFAGGSAVGGTNGVGGASSFPGDNGKKGQSRGGNIANDGGDFFLVNSILSGSTAGGNGYGSLFDGGANISSDASVSLTGEGSLTRTNARLGTIGNYGGPTQTIPLLAGSPAIDAAQDQFCLPFDQRGFERPTGAACDIGAVEVAAPSIQTQPQSLAVPAGGTASFSVTAAGASPLAYVWRFNGTNIAAATNATFTLNNVQTNNAGSYSVIVTNLHGSVTSGDAMLTVVAAPVPSPIASAVLANGDFALTFPTETGRSYVIEYKNALSDANWTPLATNSGTGIVLTNRFPTSNATARFYRLNVR